MGAQEVDTRYKDGRELTMLEVQVKLRVVVSVQSRHLERCIAWKLWALLKKEEEENTPSEV